MATEKVQLFSLDIKLDDAVKNTLELKKELAKLKEEAKKVKEEQGDLSEEYIKYQANIKAVSAEVRTQETLTKNLISSQKAETNTVEQLRKQLAVVSVQWAKVAKAEGENSETAKRLTKQKKELTETLKREEKATGDTTRNVGNYTASIQQALGVTNSFVPAVGKAGQAAALLGKAFTLALGPIGLVVAAIGTAVAAVKQFFASSEEGQDAWEMFGNRVSVVFGNISDAFSELGRKILEPKKTLRELSEFFSSTFGEYWGGMLDMAKLQFEAFALGIELRMAIFKSAFTDNKEEVAALYLELKKNEEAQKKANARIIKGAKATSDAWDNAKKAVKDFVEENAREIELADKYSKIEAANRKKQRANLIEISKLQLEISKQRNIAAQKENFSSIERVMALEKAIEMEKRIASLKVDNAKTEAYLAVKRGEFANNTIEANDEIAQKQAAIYDSEREKFEKLISLNSELSGLKKEIKDSELKAALEEARMLEQLAAEEAEASIQQLKDVAYVDSLLKQKSRDEDEKYRAARQIDLQNELVVYEDNLTRKLELQKESLEAQRVLEVEAAERVGADVNLINDKYKKAELMLEQKTQEAKLSLSADFAKNIAIIAGEGTAIGKAAAVAETTINTYKSATAAYSALAGIPVVGPALGIAAAAAATVAGFKNVQEILKVKSGLPGESSVSASAGGGGGGQASSLQVSAPKVNEGIVSRQTVLKDAQKVSAPPVLVEDEVTVKQQQKQMNNKTSII